MAKRKGFDYYGRDGKLSRELASAAVTDGIVFTPEDLLTLLFIVTQYEGIEFESLIESIAQTVYPYSNEGSKAVEKFIQSTERTAKGGER